MVFKSCPFNTDTQAMAYKGNRVMMFIHKKSYVVQAEYQLDEI